MDTFLTHWLTGSFVTESSNASRTMLMNLAQTQWEDEIIDLLGIPKSMLPEIRPSSDPNFYGKTLADGIFMNWAWHKIQSR